MCYFDDFFLSDFRYKIIYHPGGACYLGDYHLLILYNLI